MKIAIYIVIIVLLLVLSAMFSCADMTYSIAPLNRLEKEKKKGSKRAAKALKLAANYDSTIVTILFGNNLVNIIASSIGVLLARELFGDKSYGSAIVSASLLILVLTFGEITPKVLGRMYSFKISKALAPIIRVCQIIFFPFVFVSKKIASFFTKPISSLSDDDDHVPSDEELSIMLDEMESEGSVDEDKRELIESSIDFKDTSAYEIMTPRVKIEGIEMGKNLNTFVRKEGAFSHSRIPVYKKSLDNIIGYIPVKALLRQMIDDNDLQMDELIRPVLYVPSTMEISLILKEMKKNHLHIAVVKDEYGGTDGILTLEDILEELVGELYDETEVVKEDVAPTSKKNVFLVSGKMDIEKFFENFNLDLETLDSDYETLSGWINDKLGRFAQKGDRFTFSKVDIVVKKTSPYTVSEVEVSYHPRRKS